MEQLFGLITYSDVLYPITETENVDTHPQKNLSLMQCSVKGKVRGQGWRSPLQLKSRLSISTWNVITLYQTERARWRAMADDVCFQRDEED